MDPVATGGSFVLLAVTAATVTFFVRAKRRRGPVALVAAGTLGFFSGLITVGLAVGHLFGVAVVELGRSPLRYDFRVYALLLLGATLIVLGMRLVVASAGVVRGERTSWGRAVGTGVALLAVNGALAPIQGFAVALCIFVAIGLVALLAVRARTTQAG